MLAALWTEEINARMIFSLCKVYKWTLSPVLRVTVLMGLSPMPLGLLEGRAAGGAASWRWSGRSHRQDLSGWGHFCLQGKDNLLRYTWVSCQLGHPVRILQKGCGMFSCGTETCAGPQPLPPFSNLPGCSVHHGDLRGCSGAICNVLMTVLAPLIVSDGAISLSIAAWTIMPALLKWQNIH